jgi:hypothetical protein
VKVPTETTSFAFRGDLAANSPFTLTPFVDFRSSTVQAPARSDRSACRRDTEKSFRTIPFSLERPMDTSPPERRKRRVCPSTS